MNSYGASLYSPHPSFYSYSSHLDVESDCAAAIVSDMRVERPASLLKCSSSTDSGKDDNFLSTSSNSSTSDHKDVTPCCREDSDWMTKDAWIGGGKGKSGVKLRSRSSAGGTSSLERRRESRRERDSKARSAHCCPPPPPPHLASYYQPFHDCRYPADYFHYFRPPPPCDCTYNRFMSKNTSTPINPSIFGNSLCLQNFNVLF